MEIRDRIVKLVRVKANELVPCPWNWRTHPEKQKQALQAVLEEVGMAGAALARRLPDDRLMLIDGHCRTEMLGNKKIPVLELDVTEEEAKKLLLSFDPLGGMAGVDKDALGSLCKSVKTGSKALASLFSQLKEDNSVKIDPNSLEMDIEDDGIEGEGSNKKEIENSHVRMIQLFCDTESLPKFQEYIMHLGKEYGTDNLTDTIMEALRRACENGKENKKNRREKAAV